MMHVSNKIFPIKGNFLASIESSRFVSHRARIPGDSDFLRQELQPKNLGKRSRILAELSLTELICSRRSILKSSDNNIIIGLQNVVIPKRKVIWIRILSLKWYLGQSIQEWTKWNLWKTALKNFTWSILEYFVAFCWSSLKTSYAVTNDTEVSQEYPHYQEFLFDDGETSWLLLSNSNSCTIKRIATACPSSFCSVMLIRVFNFQKCIHHFVFFGNLWFFLRWLASLI